MRFGSYVTAKIQGVELAQAVMIPRHLINRGRLAVVKEQALLFRKLDIYREQGQNAVVIGGLEQGEEYITSALDYAVEGMKLATNQTVNLEQQTAMQE